MGVFSKKLAQILGEAKLFLPNREFQSQQLTIIVKQIFRDVFVSAGSNGYLVKIKILYQSVVTDSLKNYHLTKSFENFFITNNVPD